MIKDARFAGIDGRLLGLAESLGLDLGPLDAGTIRDAVADALDAQGMPAGADAASLLADLLRDEADRRKAHPGPAKLSTAEQLKRERLHALAHELARWRAEVGRAPRYLRPHAKPARGIEGVFRAIARREGARPDTVKRWALTDPEALALIATLRAVEPARAPRKPRRGLDKHRPTGDAGAALAAVWR